jgi:hypothetical protein
MWQRRSFHECADELAQISDIFRSEWRSHYRFDMTLAASNPILIDTSKKGVEILRILALAVRSEQDFGLLPKGGGIVGAVNEDATAGEVSRALSTYAPPYAELENSVALDIRGALNKIAHANPSRSGLFADSQHHEVVLCGANSKKNWVAVLSIIELCKTIKLLPDQQLVE